MLKLLVTVWIALIYLPNTASAQFFEQGQFIKDIKNQSPMAKVFRWAGMEPRNKNMRWKDCKIKSGRNRSCDHPS